MYPQYKVPSKKINEQKNFFFSKTKSRKLKTVPVWVFGTSGREEA
jgi:hypothetical protein